MNETQDNALPENTTLGWVHELREDGKVERGSFGVQCVADKAHLEKASRRIIRDLAIEIGKGTGASDGVPGEVEEVGCPNKAKSIVGERNSEEERGESERSREDVYEEPALDAEEAHDASTPSPCKRP
jgi:hypothetical protein